ncbi:MAG: hypothetical protein JWP63_475 [Candidatus Solibacter sp.]|jgi:hypothetical protein|nr:hypothetical protein [Candidatus Solibacter sp.]
MRITGFALAAAMLLPVGALYAQDMREFPVYKVEFTLRDSADMAAKNGRKYTLLVNAARRATMKVGNRVAYPTAGSGGVGQNNTQFQYFDVGVNIDCTVEERGGKYMMHADLDLSTVVPAEKSGVGSPAPTISQIKVNMDTTVAAGKPTVVASFDDPGTSRKFDVDVTLTKM